MENRGGTLLQNARRILFESLGEETYGALSHFVCKLETVRIEGWSNYRRLYMPPQRSGEERVARLHSCAHPIHFRPGTQDVIALVQNIIRQEYGRVPQNVKPQWIVDGGAYIGDVSLYYLNRYSQCRVLAFEPNPPSFALAQKNLSPYGTRVKLFALGLWSHATTLALSRDFMGARLEPGAGDVAVECVDLNAVRQKHAIEIFDLVKLDVEHAEENIILENSDDWLARTRVLIVEFHTPAGQEQCTTRLIEKGFRGSAYRELHYFINPRLLE